MRRQRFPDHPARAGSKLDHVLGNPGLMHRSIASAPISGVCPAGLVIDGIARRQRRRGQAGEDRQREIPRRNAGEHPAAVQPKLILLAGRARQRQRLGELAPRFGRIETQEIDRFAHFEHGVDQRLPGFANAEREEFFRDAPHKGRRRVRAGCARLRRRARPNPACAAWPARTMRSTSAALASYTVPTVIRRSWRRGDGPRLRPCQASASRSSCRLSSAFSRSSSGSRTSGSRQIDAGAVAARGSEECRAAGRSSDCAWAQALRARRPGSRTSSSSETCSSAMRLTKARIGAVLEQPADEIGEQLLVAADRRIDAHRGPRVADMLLELRKLLVKLLAHAVQALELERLAVGQRLHLADGVGIVGREGRVDDVIRRQQRLRTGEVGNVGRDLAREHRIIGEPADLRRLDLGVPVGALDQADHQLAADAPARPRSPSRTKARRASDRPGSRSRTRPSRWRTARRRQAAPRTRRAAARAGRLPPRRW